MKFSSSLGIFLLLFAGLAFAACPVPNVTLAMRAGSTPATAGTHQGPQLQQYNFLYLSSAKISAGECSAVIDYFAVRADKPSGSFYYSCVNSSAIAISAGGTAEKVNRTCGVFLDELGPVNVTVVIQGKTFNNTPVDQAIAFTLVSPAVLKNGSSSFFTVKPASYFSAPAGNATAIVNNTNANGTNATGNATKATTGANTTVVSNNGTNAINQTSNSTVKPATNGTANTTVQNKTTSGAINNNSNGSTAPIVLLNTSNSQANCTNATALNTTCISNDKGGEEEMNSWLILLCILVLFVIIIVAWCCRKSDKRHKETMDALSARNKAYSEYREERHKQRTAKHTQTDGTVF